MHEAIVMTNQMSGFPVETDPTAIAPQTVGTSITGNAASAKSALSERAPAASAKSLPLPPGLVEGAPVSVPHQTATGVYVTVHGHFYQPPRENPYLDAIERQPSAAPCHDWNERVHAECYRPNAFARIFNDRGEVVGIVNNFEYLSFNIGPTLMSWMEHHDPEVYQRILDADRKSCERLDGHGNAIAQVYNHIIMPLANERDKVTQIRWGKADFRSRFGRDPEGMWLAEAAVDYATLEALVAEGIRFIILAPSQVERCRPIPNHDNPDPAWHAVGGGQIDPTRPYRCFLPGGDPSQDYLDVFFYDGPISRDMGFGEVLSSSDLFAGRLALAVRGDHRPAQLISVATDGETFGHHKDGTEKCVAYALIEEFPRRGWAVTNYAHYLSAHPPTWEAVLKPVTAWSCAHGVDRWQDDCGCGGGGVWNQKWRRPLRDSLDWLRDRTIEVYQDAGRKLFRDPWQARDEYIEVIRDRSPETVERFLARHQISTENRDRCSFSPAERIDALRLLEMQRHALLMYTSCGWFFEEISRPEGTQILRYAARALELAEEVIGQQLEPQFLDLLALAPSNVTEKYQTGADIYHKLVVPAKISLEQVAAHYAMSSLFTTYPPEHRIYCYVARQLDYQMQRMGPLALATGQIELTSDITEETAHLVFAVLHLGDWDFHCCIQPFSSRRAYAEIKDTLFETLKQASAARTILAMNQVFQDPPFPSAVAKTYSLENIFSEERHRIVQLLAQETLTRLDQLYSQTYRNNYGILMEFHRDELAVPKELQVAAEIALSQRTVAALKKLDQASQDLANRDTRQCPRQLAKLESIATEATTFHCQLSDLTESKQLLEALILRWLRQLLLHYSPDTAEDEIQDLIRLIELNTRLNLEASIERPQQLYFTGLHTWIADWCAQVLQTQQSNDPAADPATPQQIEQLRKLLNLGETLKVNVEAWLAQLDSR